MPKHIFGWKVSKWQTICGAYSTVILCPILVCISFLYLAMSVSVQTFGRIGQVFLTS